MSTQADVHSPLASVPDSRYSTPMNPTITFKLETNPGTITDLGQTIFLTSQTFKSATDLLRARASVVGESRVTVVKGGM